MPLRLYAPLTPPCRLCGAGFEAMQPAGDAPLTNCPKCGQAVACAGPQPIGTPRLTAPVSVSDAKAAGFTVLRRTSAGEFEKQ